MNRLEDWPERLAAYVDARRSALFVWGEHDCVLFAAGAIEAITGVDVAADARGGYSTGPQALRWLDDRPLEAVVTRRLGQPVSGAFAQRGDVALVTSDYPGFDHALAVVLGPHLAVPGARGLVYRRLTDAIVAWRV